VTVIQNRKDFDCDKCIWGRHCDESNPAPFNQWKIPGNRNAAVIESNVCLLPMVTNRALFFIRLHKHYRNGVLFSGSGFMDQPNLYLEMMEILDGID
jgi:hypothetical protein